MGGGGFAGGGMGGGGIAGGHSYSGDGGDCGWWLWAGRMLCGSWWRCLFCV